MKAALAEAVNQIKAAGFSHIKAELEGDIGRDGERECEDCNGEGNYRCENCDSNGYVYTEDNNGNEYENECAECSGDGYRDCEVCEGSGNAGNFRDEEFCEQFMLNWVEQNNPEAARRLTFGRFYEDGSVDSEFTFTVKIEDVEDVLVWINAFKALASECGSDGIDVSGAGMHISILPATSNGSYPCHDVLPRENIRNFTTEMRKLLPALFFCASADHRSRDLGYRHASIGEDKYNAISTHDDTCLEYRVFETCYDKPEAFYDYVKVIANSLKFYIDPSLKVSALGKKFGFTDGDELARFYDTPEQLRILNATVKHLKPKDKTFKKMKEERGVHYTIKTLSQKNKQRLAQLREDYREYRRNWLEARARPLTERQLSEVDHLMITENMSRGEAEGVVRGDYNRRNTSLLSLAQFVENNLMMSYEETVTV